MTYGGTASLVRLTLSTAGCLPHKLSRPSPPPVVYVSARQQGRPSTLDQGTAVHNCRVIKLLAYDKLDMKLFTSSCKRELL